ncbi:MAG: hypothetical protein OXC54_07655 [Rhodospirillaceae bacterium]|nr:hypothetical protein [Rhodospirillaceae bacterium]
MARRAVRRIIALKSIIFSGCRLTGRQTADIRETAALLANKSCNETTGCRVVRLSGRDLPRDAGDARAPSHRWR